MTSSSIKNFWTWFLDNQSILKSLSGLTQAEQEYHVAQLQWNTAFYIPNVGLAITMPNSNRHHATLVIDCADTAILKSIIVNAPSVAGWSIVHLEKTGHTQIVIDILPDITLKHQTVPSSKQSAPSPTMLHFRNHTVLLIGIFAQVYLASKDCIYQQTTEEPIVFVEASVSIAEEEFPLCHLYEYGYYLDICQ